jgi:hypothetical protein
VAVPSPPGRGRPGPGVQDGDEVTRYLCAGAYRDAGFAQAVLDEVVIDPARAVAPAPDTDVVVVTTHCLAAVRRSLRTDLALTGIVASVAVLAGVTGILIAAWVFSWALVGRFVRSLGQGELSRAVSQFGLFLLVTAGCLFGLVLRSDGPVLRAGGLALHLPLESTQLLGLVLSGLWIVVYLDRVGEYGVLAEQLSREHFGTHPPAPLGERWRDRMEYVSRWAGSSLSIHSQASATAPFTGFGSLVHTWSAACPIARGPTDTQALSLTVLDAYDVLGATGVRAGFSVAEIVLVPGWLPLGHPVLDTSRGRPLPDLPLPVLREIAARPGGAESYRQVWTSPAAGAGTRVTGFVQLDIRDQVLVVDVALTALPAVDSAYRVADGQPSAGIPLMLRMLGAALIDVPRRTPQAPARLVRSLTRWAARQSAAASHRAAALPGAGRDFGSRAGLREIAARQPGADAMNDYDATRLANQLSRELSLAVAVLLTQAGVDPEPFARSADAVSQRPAGAFLQRIADSRVS